jgi:hypothetical protein
MNTSKILFPAFDKFTCIGDSRRVTVDGFEFVATVLSDSDSSPDDYDCYSDEDKRAWRNDEWRFVGVHVSAHKADVELAEASVWGVACNFPGTDNGCYLCEVAADLASEAMHAAKEKLAELCKA